MSRVCHFVLAGVLTLGGASFVTGCSVTKEEHRAFVDASHKFYDAVAPMVSKQIASDLAVGAIGSQSAQNRVGLMIDYGRTIQDAEKRLAGVKE